jgi:hypothetical protein
MSRAAVPSWLRRGLEAALVAAIVAIAPLVGSLLAGPPPHPLPGGLGGAVMLGPSVLALAVVTSAYPVTMAATRSDALLGALAALLLAVDATLVVAADRIVLPDQGVEIGAGLLVAALALVPAVAGLLAGQAATPFGFGRRAGGITAGVAAAAGVVVLAVAAATL